jgi:hypothetical protein
MASTFEILLYFPSLAFRLFFLPFEAKINVIFICSVAYNWKKITFSILAFPCRRCLKIYSPIEVFIQNLRLCTDSGGKLDIMVEVNCYYSCAHCLDWWLCWRGVFAILKLSLEKQRKS